MPTKRVDISQSQFKKGMENVLIEIEENRISWNKNELKRLLDEARKLDKETHDLNHAGRFKALSVLYLHFEDGKETALARLRGEYEGKDARGISTNNREKKTIDYGKHATTT